MRRFARNKLAVLAGLALVFLTFVAILGPFCVGDPLAQDLGDAFQGPSSDHLFGTDQAGRDILARVVHGSRVSLSIGFLAIVTGGVVGTTLGLIAGYRGGWTDSLIMRAMDMLLALPAILLAIVIVTWLGPSLTNAMVAIAIIRIPRFARLTHSLVLTIMPRDYILACRVIGVGEIGILGKHVLPNAVSPLIVQSTIGLASAILTAAGLGFLGLGAQPPMAEWGAMIAEGRNFLYSAFGVTLFPGLAILVTTVSFNLVGDALQDALDPRRTS